MPPRLWRERVADILESIAVIERYLEGLDEAAFAADERTMDAVRMRFAIIGEAASAVPDEVRARHPEVPWSPMRRMRNVLVHAYFGVSLQTLWKTAQEDLGPAAESLRAVLEAEVED